MRRKTVLLTCLLWIVPLSSTEIYANTGVPMLVLVWPAFGLLFFPIVALEALFARRMLSLDLRRSVKLAAVANAASTLAGIPIVWCILVLVEVISLRTVPQHPVWLARIFSVTLWSAWLVPNEADFYWITPVACIFLCIPFYLSSVWVEGLAGRVVVRARPTDCAGGAGMRIRYRTR